MVTSDTETRLFIVEDLREVSKVLARDVLPGEIFYVKGAHVDHIERILLAQFGPVRCWRVRCGKDRQCVNCRHLNTLGVPPSLPKWPVAARMGDARP
jgi:hypothetical protein